MQIQQNIDNLPEIGDVENPDDFTGTSNQTDPQAFRKNVNSTDCQPQDPVINKSVLAHSTSIENNDDITFANRATNLSGKVLGGSTKENLDRNNLQDMKNNDKSI